MADGASGGEQTGRSSAGEPGQEQKEALARPAPETAESALKDWLRLLVKAGLLALLLYEFVFQVFEVRQESMAPNYHEGNYVLVDKVTYRFTAPRLGDVVVFELYAKDEVSGRRVYRDYIKRVIAGPDDRVLVTTGAVYVNGQRLAEPWLKAETATGTEEEEPVDECYVPPGHYFVLGDNRLYSRDSRFDRAQQTTLGLIPAERIRGKVRWKCWP